LRILILVDCYYPSMKSSAKLVRDLAVEVSSRGHEAVVLTPSDSIKDRAQVHEEGGVTVVRVRTGRIKGAGRLARGMREMRLSADLWRGAESFLRANPCELILFYSPTIFFGPLVRRLKALWCCPAYLILRDIFPDWAADAGVLRRGLIYRFLRGVALRQYRAADVVAVESRGNLEHFARTFPQETFRLEVLMNWAAHTERGLPRTHYRRQLGLEGKTVFVYGGNIGVAQDMDNILRLAAKLEHREDIRFLLVGEGSEVPRLRAAIESERRANVLMLNSLAQEEYLSMISEFDVGLISLDARLTSHNVPGKLMSYLFWGMPVLASVNPGNDLLALVRESGSGFCVPNGDDDGLCRAALGLTDESELRETMGRSARRLLDESFSVAKAVDSIFGQLASHGLLLAPPEPKAIVGGEDAMPPAESVGKGA
jgi:O26-antigen biosynthesis N-acetyl-L-fucosamine transferase